MKKTNIEHLMVPRYEVMQSYPYSVLKVGDVLKTNDGKAFFTEGRNKLMNKRMLDKYPNIFRLMSWWEKREIEEMPDYVQYNKMAVYRCRWDLEKIEDERFICWDADHEDRPLPILDQVAPVTKTEYEAYTNRNDQK